MNSPSLNKPSKQSGMRSKYVVYCEHRNGRVGFSQTFRFKLAANLFAYEKRLDGYKTRVKKEWYEYDD